MNDKRTLKTQSFLGELKLLCMKHGLSLSHEDTQGAFIVAPYSEENIDWLMAAMEKPSKLNEHIKE